jgi:anaerobic selenocysteine-containing dehydrogenase
LCIALAILYVIISEKLYDFDFVNEWSYGFEELAEHVKAICAEWAAPITAYQLKKLLK